MATTSAPATGHIEWWNGHGQRGPMAVNGVVATLPTSTADRGPPSAHSPKRGVTGGAVAAPWPSASVQLPLRARALRVPTHGAEFASGGLRCFRDPATPD